MPADPSITARLRALALIGLTAMAGAALAQGGPPMVTDDPGTPGDGHWEINLGGVASHAPGRWEIAAPDADINYGWGEHVQLKLDVPWTTSRKDGEHWKSGAGEANLGLKWRLVDEESAGFALSTYPQYSRSVLSSSTRRGITGAGHQFFVPIEFSTKIGSFGVAAEVGRNFVSGGGDDQWVGGVVGAHSCGEGVECLVEVHETQSPSVRETLLNLGLRWKLDESTTLLAAAGREFGTRNDERRNSLVYLGVQFAR